MQNLERLGEFYLGKKYDIAAREILDEPILYDARDLTTHAMCIGMTGSGKTGLCIDLLEEATLDQVPSILVDPKGDLTNMLLTFPTLRPEDFRPWINPDDARRKDMTIEAYAERTAKQWADGLAQWGQSGERIRKLKDGAEFVIFTPGSEAGVPVNVLRSLQAPGAATVDDREAFVERVEGTVSALLGLVGIQADPIQSREHILLSNIFQHFWQQGQDLDIASLISAIQNPPVRTLGVLDVDTFYPPKERFGLAMALNNIIAAPSFQAWVEGVPLDMDVIIKAADGRPRVAIFYVAHLSDAERMFFVTLLLEEVLNWVRKQSGTTSLRGILYFDEVFGFLPPVQAPPSKKPLMTLLKQARAFGLGVVLTTQNPVDLDYKALTNTGTWMIGKLQTERDKMRVLEGLESASAAAGQMTDRSYLDRLISSLESRVFILHNVHADAPVVFMTRWAMSYLRGPMTKPQIKTLMDPLRAYLMSEAAVPAAAAAPVVEGLQTQPPTLEAGVPQVFLPVSASPEEVLREYAEASARALAVRTSSLRYVPMVLGHAKVRFASRREGVDTEREVCLLMDPPRDAGMSWDAAEECQLDVWRLASAPPQQGLYDSVPSTIAQAADIRALTRSLEEHLYRNQALTLQHYPELDLYSRPGESEADFAARAREAASEKGKAEAGKLAAAYDKKLDQLREKLRKEKLELSEDEAEYSGRKQEEALSAGESVLGFFLGRRSARALSTASRRRRMTSKAKANVEESQQTIARLEKEITELEKEKQDATEQAMRRWASVSETAQQVQVRPRKSDILVDSVAVAWFPQWLIEAAAPTGEVRSLALPACKECRSAP